jgi:hypothetical protein
MEFTLCRIPILFEIRVDFEVFSCGPTSKFLSLLCLCEAGELYLVRVLQLE